MNLRISGVPEVIFKTSAVKNKEKPKLGFHQLSSFLSKINNISIQISFDQEIKSFQL